MLDKSTVILPEWIWKEAKDKEDFKRLIAWYMQRYPGYRVIEIGKYFAVCEITR